MHQKIFSLPKPIFYLLVVSNVGFALWLQSKFGSAWGWTISDLADAGGLRLHDLLAIIQFVLLALTVDMTVRHIVTIVNNKNRANKIPAVWVQAVTLLCDALVGFVGYVAIYDHSFTHVLAASGAVGLGLGYVFHEMIADSVASIQIQADGLIQIGDQLQINKDGKPKYFEVVQIDHRMVTIKNIWGYAIRIPNRKFIDTEFINLSKQDGDMGSRRVIEVELGSRNDPNQVIHLMEQALQYVVHSNPRFLEYSRSYLSHIKGGVFVYLVAYSCDPKFSPKRSDSIVNTAIVRFLKLGGLSLNTDVEITRPSENADRVRSRLRDICRLGVRKVLNQNEVDRLSEAALIVRCHAGDQLITMGNQADSMYFIVEGALEVSIPDERGGQVVVATVWPGDCVGEMSLLTGEPRSANVNAKIDSVLLEIKKMDMAPIFESNPRLIDHISELLERRKAANQNQFKGGTEGVDLQGGIAALAKKILRYFFG